MCICLRLSLSSLEEIPKALSLCNVGSVQNSEGFLSLKKKVK